MYLALRSASELHDHGGEADSAETADNAAGHLAAVDHQDATDQAGSRRGLASVDLADLDQALGQLADRGRGEPPMAPQGP